MTEPGESPKKKLTIAPPPKVGVQTSIGELYVRSMNLGDVKALPSGESDEDFRTTGLNTISRLVGRNRDPEDKTGITAEEASQLPPEDIDKLAAQIYASNGFKPGTGASTLEQLGGGLRTHITEVFRPLGEVIKKAQERYTKSFEGLSSLSALTKSSLVDNLTGLAGLTAALKDTRLTDGVSDALRRASEPFSGITALQDAFKKHSLGVDADLFRRSEETSIRQKIGPIRAPELINFDENKTPMGRAANATEDAAEYLKNVVSLTQAMVEHIGTLTQNIVGKALPEWMQKVEEDRGKAKTDFQHASRNLRWAIAGIIASVFLSGLSLWSDYRFNASNDLQQQRIEKLLTTQVETMERMQKAQEQEINALKQALAESRTTSEADIQARARTKPK